MSFSTSALLLGKGPQGLGWLRAHRDELLPFLQRAMIVSVNQAWELARDSIPAVWVDYVVACDRLDHQPPKWAGVVQPVVQWGISVQRGFLPAEPRMTGPALHGGPLVAAWSRDDLAYDGVGLEAAEKRGLWSRSPEQWRAARELVHGPVTGVTALHFMWTLGVREVLAVGFDGGMENEAGCGRGCDEARLYWHGLLAMRALARWLKMDVTWQPDAAAPEDESVRGKEELKTHVTL